MKQLLLLFIILAALVPASAKDILNVKVVSSGSSRPVPSVSLTVEYPDTVVVYQADRKGRLKIEPYSFPLTMTARAEGMAEATFGFMSMPEKAVVIELDEDSSAPKTLPKRRPDWSPLRPHRLSSTFVVRTPSSMTH